MFAHVFKSAVIVSVVASLPIARGVPTSTSNNQCNNGAPQCCNQIVNSTSSQYQVLGGLLGGLGIGNIVGDIGLLCTPINVLGIGGGGECQQQAVCCSNVVQNGLFNLGCSPLGLTL